MNGRRFGGWSTTARRAGGKVFLLFRLLNFMGKYIHIYYTYIDRERQHCHDKIKRMKEQIGERKEKALNKFRMGIGAFGDFMGRKNRLFSIRKRRVCR